jgi:hypothetical protein
MTKKIFAIGSFIAASLMVAVMTFIVPQNTQAHTAECHNADEICYEDSLLELGTTVGALKGFSVPEPAWMNPPVTKKPNTGRIVTYSVTTRGAVTASLSEFKQQANQTLNDSRGWSRLGVSFSEVASGGEFTLILSVASELPNFSAGCSVEYSCNVGRNVIINQDRWLGATPSWNAAGGSIRDYRHMVVNHETGHWLGHGHRSCGGAGQAAPVMQQQSIDLQGCSFNPWPLGNELSSSRLGIS